MQGLEDLGLRENTLVIFLGDNGTPRDITSRLGDRVFPGGKGTTTEAGTRVPLIVNLPGTVPVGLVNDDLVDSTDFLPTLLDFCTIAPPPGLLLDGRSFLPQLMGEPGTPREWVFFHHDPLPGWSKAGRYLQRWAQDQRWKLYEDGRFYNVATDVLEAHAISVGQGGSEALAARRKLERVLYRMR